MAAEAEKSVGADTAVEQLAKSATFAAAVAAQDVSSAANAAAQLLCQSASQVPVETPRLPHAVSDAFKPGDHVVVQLSCPPRPSEARPHEAIVLGSPDGNGTLSMQVLRALPAPVPLHKLRAPGGAHHLARAPLDSPSARSMDEEYSPALLACAPTATTHTVREAMDSLREDVLLMEDRIPWTAVRRSWRTQRTAWRRGVRTAEGMCEIALRVRELLLALVSDDALPFSGCGYSWRAALDGFCVGQHHHPSLLLSLWGNFQEALVQWLDLREGPGLGAEAQQSALRAVKCLQQAAVLGPDALQQVPIDSIVGNDRAGLAAVRQTLEAQRQAALAQMDTAASGASAPAAVVGMFGAGAVEKAGGWEGGSGWGSGVDDSEEEDHSEVTNMSDSD